MNMQIDQARLEKAVVQQVIDYFVDDEKTFEKIRNDISARIDKLFADHATELVKKMAEDAVLNGFEREYVKIDQWGQKAGEPTSIKKELERMVSAHWSERVDLRLEVIGNHSTAPLWI